MMSSARLWLAVCIGVALCACSLGGRWGMRPDAGPVSGSFRSNGERIYFTATSERGTPITSTGGPEYGGMMMGGRLACVSCHGPDARGGRHAMHMTVMDAPDIRISALADADGGAHTEDEHAGGYDLEAFRRAVVEGRHPDGSPLSPNMPRWQMSEADLADLFQYLQSLP